MVRGGLWWCEEIQGNQRCADWYGVMLGSSGIFEVVWYGGGEGEGCETVAVVRR